MKIFMTTQERTFYHHYYEDLVFVSRDGLHVLIRECNMIPSEKDVASHAE